MNGRFGILRPAAFRFGSTPSLTGVSDADVAGVLKVRLGTDYRAIGLVGLTAASTDEHSVAKSPE